MPDPDTISADYTLRPSELAATLALLVEARQPVVLVWGPLRAAAKSAVAQQVAADAGRQYVDVRALLLDPVDLRGIPWRDSADRTRWAPPAFLPPTDDPGRWLINLEELPSAVPMVQAALYQLVLDRKVGEYELPEGASLIACGNRESDRGVVHRMPTPLASRFVHLEIRVDAQDWCAWGAANGIVSGGAVLRAAQARPAASLRSAVARSGLRLSPHLGASSPTSCSTAGTSILSPNGRSSGAPWVRPPPSSFRGVPEGLARAAPSPGRHRRSGERRGAGQRQRADRALRLPLPHGRRHQPRRHRHLRHSASAARSASSWSAPASAATRTCSARPPSSAGPPPGRSDTNNSGRTTAMNLTHDAMLVGLRISAWSGRQYDRKASNHVAVHHEASASAGRYNKLPIAEGRLRRAHHDHEQGRVRVTMSKRLPWDDQGSRLLTVANYEHYMALLDGLRERMVRERARFIEDYEDNIDQARLDLGKLFRIEDYPSQEALQGKFGIRYRITPVPDADHFMAKLASDDTDRVKRDIEHQIEERLHDAVGDLYRRLGEAVERVSERLQEDGEGKPLVFRDSMIENIRGLVDVVPRLNIFGDDRLARLCEQVKEKIASVEPDVTPPVAGLRPRRPRPREARRRRADGAVRGVLRVLHRDCRRARGRARAEGRVMSARVTERIRAARQRLRDRTCCASSPSSAAWRSGCRSAPMPAAKPWPATGGRSAIRPGGSRRPTPMSSRPPWRGWCWPARSSTTPAGASATRSAGSVPPSW